MSVRNWDLRGDCNLSLDDQVRDGKKLEIVAHIKAFGESPANNPTHSPIYMARNWVLCFPDKALKLYEETFYKMKEIEFAENSKRGRKK
jgi:hypothetical protein